MVPMAKAQKLQHPKQRHPQQHHTQQHSLNNSNQIKTIHQQTKQQHFQNNKNWIEMYQKCIFITVQYSTQYTEVKKHGSPWESGLCWGQSYCYCPQDHSSPEGYAPADHSSPEEDAPPDQNCLRLLASALSFQIGFTHSLKNKQLFESVFGQKLQLS